MPSAQSTTKRARKATKPSRAKAAAKLTHARLLKLATKHRPPQSWYDEQIDPTKPDPSVRRGR